jgi:hypothetical protein
MRGEDNLGAGTSQRVYAVRVFASRVEIPEILVDGLGDTHLNGIECSGTRSIHSTCSLEQTPFTQECHAVGFGLSPVVR